MLDGLRFHWKLQRLRAAKRSIRPESAKRIEEAKARGASECPSENQCSDFKHLRALLKTQSIEIAQFFSFCVRVVVATFCCKLLKRFNSFPDGL